MATGSDILSKLGAEHFGEVLNASPKKFREEIFRRAGVKSKGGAFALKANGKTEARVKKLRAAMLEGFELEDEIADEVVRNYLYTRRSLLAEALDFFEVEHDEGLTDAELDFIEELPPERGTHLRDLLCKNHPEADVDLYIAFMNVPTA